MGIEPVPVVCAGHGIPAPVGALELVEDDARVAIAIRRVAPDIEIAMATSGRRPSCSLKPGMVAGRMVENELGDHSKATTVRFTEKDLEVAYRAAVRMDVRVIGDVVAVVAQRGGIERQ